MFVLIIQINNGIQKNISGVKNPSEIQLIAKTGTCVQWKSLVGVGVVLVGYGRQVLVAHEPYVLAHCPIIWHFGWQR